MSAVAATVVPFRPNSLEADDARIRQEHVDSAHRWLHNAKGGVQMFPEFLLDCLEAEVWKHERLLNQSIVEPIPFHDFITKGYPVGLGASYELVERFIGTDPKLLALWEKHSRRRVGGANNPWGRSGKPDEETNVYNVHVDYGEAPPRSAGNTASAGMRRLQTAAETDTAAKAELDQVLAGDKSINAACIAMGWRKKKLTVTDDKGDLFDALIARASRTDVAKMAVDGMSKHEVDDLERWLASRRQHGGV